MEFFDKFKKQTEERKLEMPILEAKSTSEFSLDSMQFNPHHSPNASIFYHSRVLKEAREAYLGLKKDDSREEKHGDAWSNAWIGYRWLVKINEIRDPQVIKADEDIERAKQQLEKELERDKKREKKFQGKSEEIAKCRRALKEANQNRIKLRPEHYKVNFDGHKD